MKKLLMLLLAAIIYTGADAQILNKYKRQLNRAEKRVSRDTSDIVLDPIETVPEGGIKKFRAEAGITNWGSDLLRPAAVYSRIQAECTRKVTIKVADTGYKWDHQDLQHGQITGSNYTADANGPDANGHSTHCAGIIAGREFGIAYPLVAKGLLTMKPVQVLSGSGSGSFDWVKNAIAAERADDRTRLANGESVLWSGSFGGGTSNIAAVEAELKTSTDLGVLFVFAAGNSGAPGVGYPGRGAYSIAVGSLDQSLTVSSYSSRGPEVWVAAPGRGINSTFKGNTYAVLSGTSMATPCEAGILAIALSKWGNANLNTVEKARAYLAWCARDILPTGKDDDTGYGLDLITNVLDRDPKDTPAGGPTNPPPPPTPIPHEPRTIVINTGEAYDVYWMIVQAANVKEPYPFKTAGRGARKANQGAAQNKCQITSVEIQVNGSKRMIDDEHKAVKDAMRKFFTNRGFGLLAGSDDADAVKWACYFAEMFLQNDDKIDMDVISVNGKTSTGNNFKWQAAQLPHWPRQ